MTEPTTERLAYSVTEVAQSLGVSDQTVYREIAAGHLRAKKIRDRLLVTPAAIQEWLESDR